MQQESDRLTSWTKFLNALGSFAAKLVWTMIGVIVLAALGRYIFFQAQPADRVTRSQSAVPIQAPIPWHDIDTEIVASLRSAHAAAESYANMHLMDWTEELEHRIDENFLHWYFNYWQQQWLGLKSLGYWLADHGIIEKIIGEQPGMTERVTEEIQEAFSKRVLRPEIAQLQIERIAAETVKVYVAELQNHLNTIPNKYNLSQHDWERYLSDIAVLTATVEGTRDLSLTLKTFMVTGAVGGTVATARLTTMLKPMMAKIGTTMTTQAATRGAGKAAARVATKTGAKVGTRVGGKLLGPIVGVGVLIWDLWDHQHIKQVEKPILRQNLMDYLTELQHSLLYEPGTGLMTMIDRLEASMVSSLKHTQISGKLSSRQTHRSTAGAIPVRRSGG